MKKSIYVDIYIKQKSPTAKLLHPPHLGINNDDKQNPIIWRRRRWFRFSISLSRVISCRRFVAIVFSSKAVVDKALPNSSTQCIPIRFRELNLGGCICGGSVHNIRKPCILHTHRSWSAASLTNSCRDSGITFPAHYGLEDSCTDRLRWAH